MRRSQGVVVLTNAMLVRCPCPVVSVAARSPSCLSVEDSGIGFEQSRKDNVYMAVERSLPVTAPEKIALLLPMDFRRLFNSEGKDSDGSAFDDSCRHYRASDDEYDDENVESNEGRESEEKSVGGAVDGNGSGNADDAADGGLHRPVGAKDFLGEKFATEENAYAAYKKFAKLRGFGVRKGDHSVWRVRTIVDEHNHELAPAVFAHRLPSRVMVTRHIWIVSIATSKIMAYMAGKSGGYGMLQFTKRDLYNYVQGQRVARKCDGDAAVTINYQLFGNVLAFDSTYRSNKYRKPLVVFSGSNHHKQTSIFGFALLEDEEVCTYRWALLNLLDVMGQKKPCVMVTDGDKAMRTAIAEMMPTATHRLYSWYLEKNCVQRVKESEFCKASVKLLGLHDNNWVKSTYESRETWAMVYLRGTFCAGYRTTSRCEGINAFIKGFLKSTNSILELVHSLDRVVMDYRNNEVTCQFYSTYYSPALTTGLDSIERFASKVYSRVMFREVKKQFKAMATLLFWGKDNINTTTVYTFSRMGKPNRTHKVLFDPNEEKIVIKDPVISKTKGAPRKEKESEPVSQGGPSYVEHGSHDATAPSATPQTCYCRTNERMQSESGNPGATPQARADGTTLLIAHGCSSSFCRNPVGVGSGGANFFLGGQHIEQFYITQSCSGHIGQPSAQAADPNLRNPIAWTNDDLFERWLTQVQFGEPSLDIAYYVLLFSCLALLIV
ncbi:hypothetical protein Ahy_A09g044656 [Arachis hypogaea]|uniref:MULE transposase domain-containing protein n=1 Tax=Arachis hypogaea TaxID=3818 RepID=A0A445BKH6_ARAHY|nr:hypothetical protein Ahy_A09g044656 [Arachis hypogaea]